jgi:hypothetical protein
MDNVQNHNVLNKNKMSPFREETILAQYFRLQSFKIKDVPSTEIYWSACVRLAALSPTVIGILHN